MTDEELGRILYKIEQRLDDIERAQALARSAIIANIEDMRDDMGADYGRLLDLIQAVRPASRKPSTF